MGVSSTGDKGIANFVLVAFVIPLAYALVNGGIRRLTTGEKKAENAYVGVDLALAALVTAGLYSLEPQSRLLPAMRWEPQVLITVKTAYGLGVSLGIDVLALFWAMCTHSDFLQIRSKEPEPTPWHRFCTGFLNLFWNNFLGLAAFSVTAFLLRG